MLYRSLRKTGLIFFSLLFSALCLNAQVGKDGAKTINAANTVVNAYSALIADANAGATSLLVDDNTLLSNFSSALSAGDLIFIIQMQGAWMNFNDDSTYGAINGYLNAGNYEFAQVRAVSGLNTISISCGLRNSYTSGGKVQVIRVPRYTTLSLFTNMSITCPAWNGATGGVVVVEVSGSTIFNANSSIDVSGKGFRPGTLPENLSGWGVLNWRSPNPDAGGEKGEGIYGSQADYDLILGRYGKGAPANGGGGGNAHNSGGGGGANAGLGVWTGTGVPDISTAAYLAAWNLESPPIGSVTSPGGGKGGYTMSSSNADATVTGPFNTLWGGDFRRDNGGRGGRPLDYSTGRIFMGGGGGAGDQNSSVGAIGGAGGGIVFIYSYADINGSGFIRANGANGASTIGLNGVDGAGGAGAGGTIIINSTLNVAATLTLSANGGNGGSQTVSLFNNECEGPGGGGGGGYIGISAGTPARTTAGGVNGVTNSFALGEFPPNGATKGGDGISNGQVNAFRIVTSPINACAGSSEVLSFTTTGTPPAGITYSWYNTAVGGSVLGTGPTFTTPILTTNVTYYVSPCPGFARFPIQITVDQVTASYTNTSVCAGNPTSFSATATSSLGSITGYLWNYGDGTGSGSGASTSYTYALGGTYQAQLIAIDNRGCADTVVNNVTVYTSPVINFTTSASGGCSGLTVGFINNTTGGTSYTWNFGDGSPTSTATAPTHTYASAGTYTVTLTSSNPGGCSVSVSQSLTVGPRPTAAFAYATNFCLSDTVRFTNTSTGNGSTITSYLWAFGDGQTSTATNPGHRYNTAGTYNVTLTTFSGTCSDDTVITITIAPSPVAGFSAPTTAGCAPYTVTFTNASTGTTSFSWTFGDGGTSSVSNPSHTYTGPGTYSVTLIAASASCPDTLRRTNYIQVLTSPTSSFTYTNTLCQNDTVRFTNGSTGNGSTITSYQWNFGDGGTSTLANPLHHYSSPGTYNVTLRADNGACFDDTVITLTIVPSPVANFSTASVSGCAPYSVAFTNSSTGTTSFSWSFGDGGTSTSASPSHSYTTPGTYSVTLIAVSASCPDTLRRSNYIQVRATPTASFAYSTSFCQNDTVRFTNTSSGNGSTITSYQWNFGDGGTATSSGPSHYYSAPGTYNVTLRADNGSCFDDTVISLSIVAAPVASFSTSSVNGCAPYNVTFTNASTGTTSFSWSFGDGGTSTANSPSHIYSNAGTYTVTLIAFSATCPDTLIRLNYIQVGNAPTASFSSPSAVCLGSPVNFSNSSTGNGSPITSYNWTFGNGATSTLATPTYTYPSAGTYTVTLTAYASGCTNSTTSTVIVQPTPTAAFSGTPVTLCRGSSVSFANTSTGGTSYSWSFGDGGTSTSLSPSYQYNNAGTYSVSLIVFSGSCSDTITRTSYVNVLNGPTASFSTSPTICLGDTSFFSNSSNGNGSGITGYTWTFGDGGVSSATNPSHYYTSSGIYQVTLTATNGSCSDDSLFTVNVNVSPVVSFNTTTSSVCGQTPVSFINASTGTPAFTWNFGDGNTSTLSSPTHTYATPGVYTVTLIATQGTCGDTLIRPSYITVNPKPTAVFSTSSICQGDTSVYTNLSTGNGASISTYNWSFGDGNTSTIQNPRHYYSASGSYTTTLIVGNGLCSDDTSITVTVNATPVASFSATPVTSCLGSATTFSNSTTGTASYQWTFGDGNTSNVSSPSHNYTSTGTYSVTLIAANGSCADTLVRPGYISILPSPTASFIASGGCQGVTTNVVNNSTGNGAPITSYAWDFGDGFTSTAITPAHLYTAAGTYTISLTTGNGSCSDDTSYSVTISPQPAASFSSTATAVCLGTPVNFVNSSSGTSNYTWLFGDGQSSLLTNPSYVYQSPGVYSVSLIATSGSCSDTLVRNSYILVNAVPTASFSPRGGCLGDSARFVNNSNGNGSTIVAYNWTFGDGGTSSAQSPIHYYSIPGTYTVKLTVSNGACYHDTSMAVTIAAPPSIAYAASSTTACDSLTVTFQNSTSGASSYLWNFGDGQTSTLASPTHTYTLAGNYSVLLTATSGTGCSVSRLQTNYIQVKSTPVPSFTSSQSSICPGECISFTNTTTGAATSVSWIFSGASPSLSNLSNPASVCYNRTGSYNVTLQASNGSCSATSIRPAYITVVDCSAKPVAGFINSDTVFCQGSCINYRDLSTNATSWQWFFPGASPSTSTLQNPDNICYATSGNYDVRLIAGNPAGTDTVWLTSFISVNAPPPLPVFSQLGDTLIAPSGYTYQWFRNGVAISGATAQKYKATLSGNYTLQVTNAAGCSTMSNSLYISLIGFEDPSEDNGIILFPNPVSSFLSIQLDEVRGDVDLYIYDGIGQLIYQKKYSDATAIKADLSELSPANGVYFIQVKTLQRTYRRSFIISR